MSGGFDWDLKIPSTQAEQFYYRLEVREEIGILSPEFPCALRHYKISVRLCWNHQAEALEQMVTTCAQGCESYFPSTGECAAWFGALRRHRSATNWRKCSCRTGFEWSGSARSSDFDGIHGNRACGGTWCSIVECSDDCWAWEKIEVWKPGGFYKRYLYQKL